MKITYAFHFENNRTETFDLVFDKTNLSLTPFPAQASEPWTQLKCKQCKVCTLKTSEHEHCPAAKNLSYILVHFKNDISYEKVHVQVITANRITEKFATMEQGVGSLMGLIMATSGCPILDKFKPMAFIHLPFSDEIETIYRAVSMYLTAQYVRSKNNLQPDWELKYFKQMYSTVNQVNIDFSERLREIKGKDANINGLIFLDIFAQTAAFEFSDSWMKKIEPYFKAYLSE
ncbi:MAG: hypothetical protein JW795_11400 [Chitinivibrionales bacterium]|nr:hypothetical protein [Chitinivibrionales bacterium]